MLLKTDLSTKLILTLRVIFITFIYFTDAIKLREVMQRSRSQKISDINHKLSGW